MDVSVYKAGQNSPVAQIDDLSAFESGCLLAGAGEHDLAAADAYGLDLRPVFVHGIYVSVDKFIFHRMSLPVRPVL